MSTRKSRKSVHDIKTVEHARGYRSPILPVNCDDQKQRFLRDGKLPEFILRGSYEEVKKLTSQETAVVKFDYFKEAEYVLDAVKNQFGDSKAFLDATFGSEITKEQASKAVTEYISKNNLDGHMDINWCTGLACSATMMWQGPALKFNKPEARRYSLWLSDSKANTFLREQGIVSLLHHEIGTHYFRMHNDGLQPWFSDRKKFRLQPMSSRRLGCTEEGLASIHTVIDSKIKYLWTGALLYYTACKAEDLSFRELFEHLEKYISDKEQRWKHCIRVKRGLYNVNVPGGYGKDQCYFEGAVKILRNLENIDFLVLMTGKICYDEVERCKRLARTDIIKLPDFMYNMERYKRTLRHIARINGLAPDDIPRPINVMQKRKPFHVKKTKSAVPNHHKDTAVPEPITPSTPTIEERPKSSHVQDGDTNMSPRQTPMSNEPSPKGHHEFRYTHTPIPHHNNHHVVCSEDSTVLQTAKNALANEILKSRSSSPKFDSSHKVWPPRPDNDEGEAPRAQSACDTKPIIAPEIKRYSERLIHRDSLHKTKSSKKRKRKKSKPVSHKVLHKKETESSSDDDDEVVLVGNSYGCLRARSQQN